jgi:uncharacterized protein
VVPGFVATGAVIGSRFRGTTLATLRTTLPGALGSVLLALTLSAGFTAAGVLLLGLPFGQLWLAYAPGGVEAMAAMALALGLEPAFVGAHHVTRIIGLNLAGPLWLRARGGRPEPAAVEDGSVAKSRPAEPDEQHPSPGRTGRPR